MTPEALDFRAECEQIQALLKTYDKMVFARVTQFKGWTISDIIGHLHLWNIAADLSLNDPEAFTELITFALTQMNAGRSHSELQSEYFKDQSDQEIFTSWTKYYPKMTASFHSADPELRVKWVGPDMSVRSCIIARQMEHWAHAQAIFDILGLERKNTDRLKNVAHIGVTTFSWSFRVRGKTPPAPKPYVALTSPSGEIWTWNEPQTDNQITGSATEFSQVVTQCRHIKDTQLVMTGDIAAEWMAHAQCFAGVAETPPPAGTRYRTRA